VPLDPFCDGLPNLGYRSLSSTSVEEVEYRVAHFSGFASASIDLWHETSIRRLDVFYQPALPRTPSRDQVERVVAGVTEPAPHPSEHLAALLFLAGELLGILL
jgi:hypothetical protein